MVDKVSRNNWGKWGEDDQRGALNRIDVAATKRGIAAVKAGHSLPLAIPLSSKGPIAGMRANPQHFMTRDGGDYCAGLKEKGFGYADDVVILPTHGTTHIDALAHVWSDGKMWNGYSCNQVTSRGASKCSIESMGPIVTRGIFLDFAGPDGPCEFEDVAISVEQLQLAYERTELQAESGDALIVRTGWLQRWRNGQAKETLWAGLDPDCADWINEKGFALVAADNIAVEFGPSPLACNAAPMHVALMRNFGVVFMELLDLEALAISARHDFLLMVSPLPIVGGVGSPVNPIAVL
ncbi:cyclase family protein [Halioxenophilus aromaticivorans]|uniref:Cyclase family protein n=1 Tax=Halioxenophilus aromaticivorans TaxID=1306992 RepID=A0AAV3TX63_9ALTE